MDFQITSGKIKRPRKTVVHGEHGTGKSTWASRVGKALFICTEDGTNDLDVDRLPLVKSYSDVVQQIQWIAKKLDDGEIDHEVVALDSADWLEGFIDKDLERESFDTSYGKGVAEIAMRFGRILSGLDMLVDRGVMPIVIAHSQVREIKLAEGGSYDRWEPKLSKKANGKLLEWADEVLYASMETVVRSEDTGFGSSRGIGVVTGKRSLRCRPGAGYMAKNRCQALPASIDTKDAPEYTKYFA